MRLRIALTATAALVALAGCSSTDDGLSEATSAPATSAPATSAPATSAPPTSSMPSPASTPRVGGEGSLSLAEACPAVVADVRAAIGTVTEYVKNPLNGSVTVRDLEQVRSQLNVDEISAPEELRGAINEQVGVLNDAIEDLKTGNVPKVDVAKFQAAGQEAIDVCSDAVR